MPRSGRPRRLLFTLLLFFLLPLATAQAETYRPWWLADPGQELAVAATLDKPGRLPVLGARTSRVALPDFTAPSPVAPAELEHRLDARDPRQNPWLRHVPQLFTALRGFTPTGVLWLPDQLTDGEALQRLQAAGLAGAAGPLDSPAGAAERPVWLAVLVWLAGLVLLWFLGSLRRGPHLVSAAWWTLALAVTSWALVVPALVSHAALVWLADWLEQRLRRRANGQEEPRLPWWPWAAAGAGAVFSATGLWLGWAWTDWLVLVAGLGGAGAGGRLWYRHRAANLAKVEHKLFFPLKISAEKPRRPAWQGPAWAGFCLLVVLPLFFPGGTAVAANRPAPAEFSLEKLHDLWQKEKDSPAPTLSQWVAHQALVDSFVYGGTCQVPAPGDQVDLRHFNRVDGRLAETAQPVVVFDQKWLDGQWDRLDPRDPVRLLVNQQKDGK